jgi:predicted nucleic acid-binding protein
MTSLIVDASVAVKWLLDHADSERARALQEQDLRLVAPDLVHAEVGSALWKVARAGQITGDKAVEGLKLVVNSFDAFEPIEVLSEQALRLSLELGQPIYDCFYLALAQRDAAPLVTADRKLAKLGERLPTLDIRLL